MGFVVFFFFVLLLFLLPNCAPPDFAISCLLFGDYFLDLSIVLVAWSWLL